MIRADANKSLCDDWATSLAPLQTDPRFPTDQRIAELSAHHDTLSQRTRVIHGARMCDASDDAHHWGFARAAIVHVLLVAVLIACAFVMVWASLAVREH